MDEFERLNEQERLRNHFTTVQGDFTEQNKVKNRILPYTHSRVKIRNCRKSDGHINASWILKPEDERHYDSISALPYLSISKVGLIVKQISDESNDAASKQVIYENDVAIA